MVAMVRYSSRLVVRRSMRLVRPDRVCLPLSPLRMSIRYRLSFFHNVVFTTFRHSLFPYASYARTCVSLPSCKGNTRNPRDNLMSSAVERKKKFHGKLSPRMRRAGKKRRKGRQSRRSNAFICKKVCFFFLIIRKFKLFKLLSGIAFCHAAVICAMYAVAAAMKWLQRYIFIMYPLDRDIK